MDMDHFRKYSDAFVLRVVNDEGEELMGENVSLFATPKELILTHNATISVVSIKMHNNSVFEIILHSDKPALYVVLSCEVQGRFSDNAFLMQPNKHKVSRFHM